MALGALARRCLSLCLPSVRVSEKLETEGGDLRTSADPEVVVVLFRQLKRSFARVMVRAGLASLDLDTC